MTLLERFEMLCARPDRWFPGVDKSMIVDTAAHLPFLRAMAKGNVLEIGVDVGNTTIALLLGIEEQGGHLYSVDIRDCSQAHVGNPNWTFIRGNSNNNLDFVDIYEQIPHKLDSFYLDGDHSYSGSRNDLFTYGALVKRGGIIAVHDVLHYDYPGTAMAFHEYASAFGCHTQYYGQSWGLGVTIKK